MHWAYYAAAAVSDPQDRSATIRVPYWSSGHAAVIIVRGRWYMASDIRGWGWQHMPGVATLEEAKAMAIYIRSNDL